MRLSSTATAILTISISFVDVLKTRNKTHIKILKDVVVVVGELLLGYQ